MPKINGRECVTNGSLKAEVETDVYLRFDWEEGWTGTDSYYGRVHQIEYSVYLETGATGSYKDPREDGYTNTTHQLDVVVTNSSGYSNSSVSGIYESLTIGSNETKLLGTGAVIVPEFVYPDADNGVYFVATVTNAGVWGGSFYSWKVHNTMEAIYLQPVANIMTITSVNFPNDESNPVITYYLNERANYRDMEVERLLLYATLPDGTELFSTRDIAIVANGTYTVSLSDEARNLIVSSATTTKTAYIYFHLRTTDYDGHLFDYEVPVNCTIINANPIINQHIETTDGLSLDLTYNPNAIIADVSDVYYEIGATPQKGATIVSQYVTCDGKTQYLAAGTYENVHNPRFTFTVVDSRGNSTTKVVDQTYIPYFPITCNLTTESVTIDDVIATSKFKVSGKYYNGTFGPKDNTLYIEYRYAVGENGSFGEWKTSTPLIGEEDYLANIYITEHYQNSIVIEVKVYDSITQRELTQTYIAAPAFDWGQHDFNFNVPVTINGDLTVTGEIITNTAEKNIPYIEDEDTFYSGTGLFNYRKWSDGMAECWGSKDFSVNVSTAWGSMYTTGAISGSNISFPSGLFTATPNIQATLRVRSAGGILMAPGGAGSNIASKSQTGVYEIARGTALTGAAYTIDYYARGTWK